MGEACEFLPLDCNAIRLVFVEHVNIIDETRIGVDLLKHEDLLAVSNSYLKQCIQLKSFSPLRWEIYSKVYIIFDRAQNKRTEIEYFNLGRIFASAIISFKGLCLLCPPGLNPNHFFEPIIGFTRNMFGFSTRLLEMPLEPFNGAKFYKMALSSDDARVYFKKYFASNQNFTGTCPVRGEKGSKENPFENINDAVNYLNQVERQSYQNDSLMNDLANQKYFYDIASRQFRIGWASPYVAIYKNEYPRNSFIMSQMDTGYFAFKPNLYRHKFLYRGQSDYYPNKPCVPNLYRDDKHNKESYYLDYLIFAQEMEIFIRSHPLVQFLEKGFTILHDFFKIRMHYHGLAQHYYNKSWYLDLTSNIEVAKFFAVTDYNFDNDEYHICNDTDKTGVIYYYELLYPNAFTQHKGYALKNIGKQVFMRSGAQQGFLLEMEKGIDFKTLPQVKAVYFKHNPHISSQIFNQNNQGHDFFGDDLLQLAWNNQLKERYKKRVVSKMTVDYNAAFNRETPEAIIKKLAKYHIEVDNYVPRFTDDELKLYYEAIRNGWWADFCDDIHFYGPEDELYRAEMKDIQNKPEYRSFFINPNRT